MRIALINPPQAHFTQPLLAIPSLAAFLKENGFRDLRVVDASIESYDYFLSGARLSRALERIGAKKRLRELDRKSGLLFSEMETYQMLSEVAVSGETIAARIDEAKDVIRSADKFYDYERYLWAARTVERALRIFSAEFAPTRLTAHGFVMKQTIERSDEIFDALADEAHNPYIEYYRDVLMPRIREMNPDFVGLSITFGSQAIPGFTLARMIKEWKPDCYITVGGGLLAYVAHKLSKRAEIWSVIDSFVMLEGERPLLELCKAVEAAGGAAGRADVAHISNLIYFDKKTGAATSTREDAPLDIKLLPTPDFDGMPLHLYFSPELVLPLAITRGCYWGKCVFCTLFTVIGPGYRGRTVEQTVDDIRKLKEKHGTRHFYMVIEDLPPNMAKRLPSAILEANLDIDWWCDARLEHDVFDRETVAELARSGCKRIAFGYESANKRVLDRMCKGIDPDASMQLIHRCHDAGISVTLYVMIGFPTETRDEALQTLAAIVNNRDKIQEVSARVFYLDEHSEIYKRAREFDIKEIHPDPRADLQVYYDFTPGSGMTRREAREVYLKFTGALRSHFPVFQNTNMLYHELKSHYFLFLAKHGSFENLRARVLEPAIERTRGPLPDRPRRVPGLVAETLRFDRDDIDVKLITIDSGTVRPRYHFDILGEDDRNRFDREVAPLAPSASELFFSPADAETHCLSANAAELLRSCDGTRQVPEILGAFPAEFREDAGNALRSLAEAGLLVLPAATAARLAEC
ncbi:MAG: radical SAM protein [Planctomycetes bacterium]|nr:radical SAM protein [Planctomycetota bacterium]